MENDLNKSLLLSVVSDLSPVTTDLTEIIVDSFLDDGLIKSIPFISTISSLIKTGANIRERLFAKKLLKFLFELKSISQDERFEFISKLSEDSEFRNNAGEKVLSILDKLEDSDKAAMVGRLFKACIQEKFSFKVFLRLSYIINSGFISDLRLLSSSFIVDTHTYHLSKEAETNLYRLGLAKMNIITDTISNTMHERTHGKPKLDLNYKMEYRLNAEAYTIAKEVFDISWIEYGRDIHLTD